MGAQRANTLKSEPSLSNMALSLLRVTAMRKPNKSVIVETQLRARRPGDLAPWLTRPQTVNALRSSVTG